MPPGECSVRTQTTGVLRTHLCKCVLWEHPTPSHIRSWHSPSWMCFPRPAFWKEERDREGEPGILRVQPPWKHSNAPAGVGKLASQIVSWPGSWPAVMASRKLFSTLLLFELLSFWLCLRRCEDCTPNKSLNITLYRRRQEAHGKKVVKLRQNDEIYPNSTMTVFLPFYPS